MMVEPPERRDEPGSPEFPEAIVKPRARFRLQLVWLVPLVAVLIGGWLVVQAVLQKGPAITISFKTGEGLEAGKTKVKYKDVDIGVVKSVTLSKDHHGVVATAELSKDASSLLVDDTRFWVVRPRISGGTVSGLGTVLSGSYIGMDVGTQAKPRHDYVGLEVPPVFAKDVAGREFVLKSADMGSLDIGTPVFFRRLQVGQISSYTMDPDGNGVTLRAFVNAPYDKYVRADARFWHASGIDVSLDTSGVRVDTQSVVAILIGGIAFESPADAQSGPLAGDNAEFTLFRDRAEAMKRQDRLVDTYVFNFKESVRGLTVGAPVDFRGIVVGEVTGIYTRFNREKREFSIPVEVKFFPERFTSRYQSGGTRGRVSVNPREMSKMLVELGLRGQLRTGNLLTGQLYVALDFFPAAPKGVVDWSVTPPEFPTVPGGLQSLQDSLSELVAKLNKVPFEGIGKDVRVTLQNVDKLLKTLDTDLAPEARAAMVSARSALDSANSTIQPDSALVQSTADTMRELSRTAASLRALADYLERNPEALIRGKTENKK